MEKEFKRLSPRIKSSYIQTNDNAGNKSPSDRGSDH
ncbi:hypothetical protein PC116_g29215 [Phytophthora cactorum]|nr:hypothetical protein PC116_g29215 [Phytophthora cactorum]